MVKKSVHHTFWKALAQEVKGIPGGRRYLKKLRKTYLEAEYAGEKVACLKEGPPYQKALEMVAADLEVLVCKEKLRCAEERLSLKTRAFWLSIFEETGLDEDEGLIFDPLNLRILSKCTSTKGGSYSHKLSLDKYKDIVSQALFNPSNASYMIKNPYFNFPEIKRMAEVIINGDFKPNLRRMIEQWVVDPAEARESESVLKEEGMPSWLVEIASKLGQIRKR